MKCAAAWSRCTASTWTRRDVLAGSLFSGVGGLDLGLAQAGWQHAFFCESDPWRRSVLAHHWPGVPIYEDVRAVDATARAAWEHPRRRAVGGSASEPTRDAALVAARSDDLVMGDE